MADNKNWQGVQAGADDLEQAKEYAKYGVQNQKKSFSDYESVANTTGSKLTDALRYIDPISWAAGLGGSNFSVFGAAGDVFGNTANKGQSMNDKVRFGGWNGGPAADTSNINMKAIYDSMSPEELEQVGGMSDGRQKEWLIQRWGDINSRKVNAVWKDPVLSSAEDDYNAAYNKEHPQMDMDQWAMQNRGPATPLKTLPGASVGTPGQGLGGITAGTVQQGRGATTPGAPGSPQVAQPAAPQDPRAAMMDFYNEMMKPLDPNDPYIKALMDPIRNGSTQGANDRGLDSGWAGRLGDQAVISAGAQLMNQRQGLGLNALANAGAYVGQQDKLREQSREYDSTLANNITQQNRGYDQQQWQNGQQLWQNQFNSNQYNNQLSQQMYGDQMNRNQASGAGMGSLLGLGIAAYTGNWGAAGALMKGAGGIGAGLNGNSTSAPSYTRQGSRGGLGGTGGNR